MTEKSKLLSLAGLCRRAGGICPGAEVSVAALRGSRKPTALILSCDASERTRKQVTDKAETYSVPLYICRYDSYDIGHALGMTSPVSVFAVTGKGPAVALKEAAETECEKYVRTKRTEI